MRRISMGLPVSKIIGHIIAGWQAVSDDWAEEVLSEMSKKDMSDVKHIIYCHATARMKWEDFDGEEVLILPLWVKVR